MKKQYVPAEIDVFMFLEKQVVLASGVTETTLAEHDNAFLDLEDC